MSQPLNVAVVGATGSVGEALVGLLDERDFPLHRLHLLASAESAGQRMGFAESSLRVAMSIASIFPVSAWPSSPRQPRCRVPMPSAPARRVVR